METMTKKASEQADGAGSGATTNGHTNALRAGLLTRADFSIVVDAANALVIRDDFNARGSQDYNRTVTNDVENVVLALAPQLRGRRLFYIDTDGRLDEILYEGERFLWFGAIATAENLAQLQAENDELRDAVKAQAPLLPLRTYDTDDRLFGLLNAVVLLEERGDRCHIELARTHDKITGVTLSVEDL